ncbi:hypothetical protein Prudu_007580, partial [Prunus dulcis]
GGGAKDGGEGGGGGHGDEGGGGGGGDKGGGGGGGRGIGGGGGGGGGGDEGGDDDDDGGGCDGGSAKKAIPNRALVHVFKTSPFKIEEEEDAAEKISVREAYWNGWLRFQYRMVVDSRYQKVAKGKSRLSALIHSGCYSIDRSPTRISIYIKWEGPNVFQNPSNWETKKFELPRPPALQLRSWYKCLPSAQLLLSSVTCLLQKGPLAASSSHNHVNDRIEFSFSISSGVPICNSRKIDYFDRTHSDVFDVGEPSFRLNSKSKHQPHELEETVDKPCEPPLPITILTGHTVMYLTLVNQVSG